jgi:eukaryotic-like serine/threonine-protein kinase
MAAQYKLLKQLASGGMAEVWLAQQVNGELVVLKRIHPHLMRKPGFRNMFVDEARTAMSLAHRNVVRMLDFGAIDGADFIVLEYLRGRDLRQVLHRCQALNVKIPTAWALSIVRGAAIGLAHAHAQRDAAGLPRRIVHRDVSPENLFLTFTGDTKVLDFGVAAGSSRLHQTESGVLKGKCEYMSPEQIDGETVDHRSDQFSLGTVLYELLARTPLFARRTTGDTLRAVSNCKVGEFPFGTSVELESALRRCLSKDRKQRFESCTDFAAALVIAPEFDWRAGASARMADWVRSLFPEGDSLLPDPDRAPRTTRDERLRTA